MNVTVRSEAEADLRDACQWYEARRQGLGHRFLDEVVRVFDLIAEHPRGYPRVHGEVGRALIRPFPFGVLCLMDDNGVVVIAAMHLSRDPARRLDRT